MEKQLSILIADDHDTIASGLKYELQTESLKHFICAAASITDALDFCRLVSFDLAIIDISFKTDDHKDGIVLAKVIKAKYPSIKIIVYSSYTERLILMDQLMKIGVEAIASKTDGNKAIKDAILHLSEDNVPFYSPLVLNSVRSSKLKKDIYISKRERDVIVLLRQHKSYREIALELGISKNTVDFHAKNLYSKFNVHKMTELLEKVEDYL